MKERFHHFGIFEIEINLFDNNLKIIRQLVAEDVRFMFFDDDFYDRTIDVED